MNRDQPVPPRVSVVDNVRHGRIAAVARATVIFLFVLAITVPFLGQAFHVDDAIFWDFARNNLSHPLEQHLPNYFLMGKKIAAMRDTHPPLDELYISLIMSIEGVTAAEFFFHLGFIVFPLIAGVSMYFLGRRFTKHPLAASLLFLSAPAVMVMSHTLMADLPMTALWMAATAAYIYGVDADSRRLLAFSSLLITLAIFMGYQSLALLVLLPAYAWLRRGRPSRRNALPFLLPLLSFALFTLFNYARYNSPPRFSHAGGLGVTENDFISRFQGMILEMGGITIFPPLLAAGFTLRRKKYLALPLIAAIAALLGWRQLAPGYPVASAVLFGIFIFAGASMLTGLITEGIIQIVNWARRLPLDRDFLFLALWLISILAAIVILLPHTPAKYYLPVFAPLILLMFREVETVFTSRRIATGFAVLAIVLSLVTGFWLSLADYELARAYKDFALSIQSRYRPSGTVWFVGEWGFRHYMEQQNYKYLTSDSTAPKKGDLIIEPSYMQRPVAPSLQSRMHLIGEPAANWDVPVRVMNMQADAGFYGTYWGRLPFTITSLPLERFKVYVVSS